MGITGSTRDRGALPMMIRVLLALGFAVSIAATVIVVVAEDVRLLRLAVVLALWAALIAAFAVARSRRDAKASAMREDQAQMAYELELTREVAARREYEADLSRQTATVQADQIADLREELARLADVLSSLTDGELTYSRLTLSAESARFTPQVSRAAAQQAVTPGSWRNDHDRAIAAADEDDDAVDAEIVPSKPSVEPRLAAEPAPATGPATPEPVATPEPEPEPEPVATPEPEPQPAARHSHAAPEADKSSDSIFAWAEQYLSRHQNNTATSAHSHAAPDDHAESAAAAGHAKPEPELATPEPQSQPAPEAEPHVDAQQIAEDVSVSDLLAAYGLSGSAGRRRRRE